MNLNEEPIDFLVKRVANGAFGRAARIARAHEVRCRKGLAYYELNSGSAVAIQRLRHMRDVCAAIALEIEALKED